MAVVQISKIQVRRGQKYSNTGVPQLSSGEFAWAVDSQELFIGNGSIAEGSPYVGNTKILTEHDNIMELLSDYTFAHSDPSITGSVPRSLQQKLDEYVSVLDFGAVADGVTDCTAAFQTALDELFLNVDVTFKRKLLVPPGNYRFLRNLYIPSSAYLQGENPSSVNLIFNDYNIMFKSADETLVGFFNSSDHPMNIKMADMSLTFSTGSLDISGVTDTLFDNITVKNGYILGDDITDLTGTVKWTNEIFGSSTNRVTFRNCNFKYLPIAFECTQIDAFETNMIFEFCNFNTCGEGIWVNGVSGQRNSWQVRNCSFDLIAGRAFYAPYGYNTQIIQSNFSNCGNGTNTPDTPEIFIIEFGESSSNIVRNCKFDRIYEAGISTSFTKPAINEVRGGGLVEIVDRVETPIYLADSFRPLAVFSALNTSTEIDYTLTIGTNVRKGTLTIGVDKDRTSFSISDNYQYATGDDSMTFFNFDASLQINFPSELTDSSPDTLVLTYENPTINGAAGTISYSVTYSV